MERGFSTRRKTWLRIVDLALQQGALHRGVGAREYQNNRSKAVQVASIETRVESAYAISA
jgi:hypothetical protein